MHTEVWRKIEEVRVEGARCCRNHRVERIKYKRAKFFGMHAKRLHHIVEMRKQKPRKRKLEHVNDVDDAFVGRTEKKFLIMMILS